MEQLIKQAVRFDGNVKGWNNLKCKICNDYKIRAAFHFDDTKIKYNCFNCGHNAYYFIKSDFISKEFRQVLDSIGINQEDTDLLLAKSFFNNYESLVLKKKVGSTIPICELPKNSYRLTSINEEDPWTIVANEYLESRGMTLDSHKWFLCSEDTFRDRLLIPYYKDEEIIYWQARSFLDNVKKRYINASCPIENVLFGYEHLYKSTDSPLFITEGVFDAISINGISMLGSKLYKPRIEAFNKSKRRKIFVIDKKDKHNNGYNLGLEVLKHGWEITFITGNTKDINDSIIKYGKLWTIKNLVENIKIGFEAKVYLETLCKNNK